jgi:hypothetical protein
MKEFCINQSKFEKVIGYTLWGSLTFGLCLLSIAMFSEIDSQYFDEGVNPYNYDDKFCRVSFVDGSTVCWDTGYGSVSFWANASLFPMIINFVIIALWTYCKQKHFKITWYKND